jgi:hypothetical protein
MQEIWGSNPHSSTVLIAAGQGLCETILWVAVHRQEGARAGRLPDVCFGQLTAGFEREHLRVLQALFPDCPRLRAMFVQFMGGLNGCGASCAGRGGSQPGRTGVGCVPASGPPGVAEQSVVGKEQGSAWQVWQNLILRGAAAFERLHGPRIGHLPAGPATVISWRSPPLAGQQICKRGLLIRCARVHRVARQPLFTFSLCVNITASLLGLWS